MSNVLVDSRPALSMLSEDETLFRDAVRDFAESELAARAMPMDQAQEMDADLLPMLFEMGLMGIEIPEELGGAGSTFFTSILIVEELSRIDPAVGVLVVLETLEKALGNGRHVRLGRIAQIGLLSKGVTSDLGGELWRGAL